MISAIYLVLVITTGKGLSTELIPQANMKQCEINKAYFERIKFNTKDGYLMEYKPHCIVGTK